MKKAKVTLPSTNRFNKTFPVIIVCIVPFLLYLQTISFGFTYFDDNDIILKNLTFLSDCSNLQKAFLTDQFITKTSTFYRPLGTLSYMVDILLSGGNMLWMYHLTNVLLLVAIAGSLYVLLQRLRISPALAFVATLLFCVHPLFVSTVAHIQNRAELLLILFTILSFIFLIDYFNEGKTVHLILHIVSFTLALFSKETAAFLPFLYIAYYIGFHNKKRLGKKQFLTILWYALLGIFWLYVRHLALAGAKIPSKQEFGMAPFISNLQIIPECITKLFLPFDFAPIPCFSIIKTILGIILLSGLIMLLFKNKQRTINEKLFCFAWFILLQVPSMLYKLPDIDYSDHRFFLPLLGILFVLLFSIPQSWIDSITGKQKWIPIGIFLILATSTYKKSGYYSNAATFYNTAISLNPNATIAYYNRGAMRAIAGDKKGAIDDYSRVIAIKPTYVAAYYNRGNMRLQTADYKGAIDDFSQTIALSSNHADVYNNRGNAKVHLGDTKGAIDDYTKAIAIDPTYLNSYLNCGVTEQSLGNFDEAIRCYSKAIAINPSCLPAYFNRALAYNSQKKYANVIEDCNQILAHEPNNRKALILKMKAASMK